MITLKKLLPAPQGKALSNRYQMRRFAHNQDAHAFLAKGENALHWQETRLDLKSGVYRASIDLVNGKPVETFARV